MWAYHYEKVHRKSFGSHRRRNNSRNKKSVAKGNKVFGGAILTKSDYTTITIGVNEETENPLFHGEISTLNKFLPKTKIGPQMI